MTREKKLQRNITLIQLYYFFRSFVFAYTIERLFWASRGMTISKTVYVEIIYAVVVVLFEIPTGVWADCWQRRKLIMLGAFISLLGSIAMVYAYGFIMFAIIISSSAISGALTSGSVSALVYDGLKELGRESMFEKYIARIKAIRYSSGLFAALIGAYLASNYTLVLPYQATIISGVVMFSFTLFLVEPKRNKGKSDTKMTAKEIINISKDVILKSKFLIYVMLVGSSIGAAIIYFEEFWQNYCTAINIEIKYFGLISAMMSIVVIFAASHTFTISKYIKESFKRKRTFYNSLLFIMSMSFILIYFTRNIFGLIFMVIATYVAAISDIVVSGDIHHKVESGYRATIESVYSMILRVMSVIIGLIFGLFSDYYSIFSGFLAIGIIVQTIGLLTLLML